MKLDNKCDECENISICKWCSEMKSKREYVSNIPKVEWLSPIKVRIVCDSFKKKTERQDGWYKTGQRGY